MGFGSFLKKALKAPIELTKKAVSQDSRNIRSIAGALGGSSTGSGLMSSLYREADYNTSHPTAAMRKAAITAATWYAGGLAGAYAGSAAGGAGLTAAQQAAVAAAAQGATTGGLNAAANGGNVGRGILLGGLTGGLGSYAGPAISQYTGMPSWAANAIGRAGTGALGAGLSGGNPWQGALAGGASSLASSGLSAMGAGSGLSGFGGQLAGRLAGSFAGGQPSSVMGGSARAPGMGGYNSASYSPFASPGTTVAGLSGGLGRWQDPTTLGEQQNAAYLASTGSAVNADEARRNLVNDLVDDPTFMAKLKENPQWAQA